jgi:hypothetical protein
VSPCRSDCPSSSGVSCDYPSSSLFQDVLDTEQLQQFSSIQLSPDERETLTKLNSMNEDQMTDLLRELVQQNAELGRCQHLNTPSLSSEDEIRPMGAIPLHVYTSITKHPLRDSAYQSKEQSTEQYNSSKVGSTTVSPKQAIENANKSRKDRPPLK